MRWIKAKHVLAVMIAATACSGDRAVAPKSGQSGEVIPPELIADYTLVYLPGKGRAVALNDSGDVVGTPLFGAGILWHGAAHDTTILPIVPTAIANDGTVAGIIDGHAATWKSGRVTILDTAASVASAICKCQSATVVGAVLINGVYHAAIWVDGIRIDAGLPPNSVGAGFVAIDNGFIVGNADFNVPGPSSGVVAYTEPYAWSHAEGWVRLPHGPVSNSTIVSVNSHGIAVGRIRGAHEVRPIFVDIPSGTGEQEFPPNPFFSGMNPTGINDSNRISATGYIVDPGGFISGIFKPLVSSTSTAGIAVLPPGGTEATTAGINNAGVIAGNQGEFEPAIWIPNP